MSFGDAAALSGGSLEDVGPSLSELVNSGIVVEEERGTELTYELHHPLVRDVIYQATGGARRRVLHRQAARSLLRAGHLARRRCTTPVPPSAETARRSRCCSTRCARPRGREAYREALELQAELVDLLPAEDAGGSRCWMRCMPGRNG